MIFIFQNTTLFKLKNDTLVGPQDINSQITDPLSCKSQRDSQTMTSLALAAAVMFSKDVD